MDKDLPTESQNRKTRSLLEWGTLGEDSQSGRFLTEAQLRPLNV